MFKENLIDIKILIVEDEKNIFNAEKKYLKVEGLRVGQAFDGQEVIDMINSTDYPMIILDLMLPKISGEKVVEVIRSRTETPAIMVTTKIDEDEILEGLKLGADGYITKPFSSKTLVQKVETILRRVEKLGLPRSDKIYFNNGRVSISFDDNTFIKDGESISLTSNKFQIIKTLFSNPNKIFTRDGIAESSFGCDYEVFDRAIDTHIKDIRYKVEDDPRKPRYIKTIYGVGYKLGVYDEA